MNEDQLQAEYEKLCKGINKVYVIPIIDYSSPKTNYLYLLYKNFIEQREARNIKIESLSVIAHPKIFFSRLINEKSLVHYHWLEIDDFKSLTGMLWKMFWIKLYKIFGGKIIWTVHNKFPHTNKYKYLNKILRKYMAHIADRLHVHCKSAIDIMTPILNVNREKFFIVNHPEYPVILIPKNEAIEWLCKKYPAINLTSGGKIFLMFGAIAEYKGIIEVIEIFKQDLEDLPTGKTGKILIVAGPVKRWDEKYFSEVLAYAKGTENIFINGKMIPDEDVSLFLNSADYLLFNYLDVLSSGGILQALSYGKSIIAPSIGCLQELNGNNIIKFEAGNKKELRKILMEIN